MLRDILSRHATDLKRPEQDYRIENRDFWDQHGPERREVFIGEATQTIDKTPVPFSWEKYNLFFENGNRIVFENDYFDRRRLLNLRILAECFENQGRFLPAIIESLRNILDEPIWTLPAHIPAAPPEGTPPAESGKQTVALFSAETAAQLSLAAYILQSILPPELYEEIQTELNNRIFRPYATHFYTWMGQEGEKLMNWTTWISQNMLIAIAYADPKIPAEAIIEKAVRSLDIYYTYYGDDGCCDEGPQYYRHAGLSLSTAMYLLSKLNPAFAAIYKENKYRNIALFILNMHIDGEYYFNFADASTKAGHCSAREFLFGKQIDSLPLMNFAAEDVRKNPLAFSNIDDVIGINLFYCLIEIELEEEILNFRCSAEDAAKARDVDYPSCGVFIRRRGPYQFAAKAGHNNDAHNHNDVGSFTLYKNGLPFLIDVGVETYQRKTFSDQRYTIWTIQSAYHNLPTFGQIMEAPGAEFKATDLDVRTDSIGMNIATAYPPIEGLSHYTRVFAVSDDKIVIEDSSDYPQEIMLSLMSQEKPIVKNSDKVFTIRYGSLGSIIFEADRVEVDTFPIEDPRLRKAWPDTLYRARVYFKASIKLEIR